MWLRLFKIFLSIIISCAIGVTYGWLYSAVWLCICAILSKKINKGTQWPSSLHKLNQGGGY